jgi:hypothetical protein
MNRTIALVLKSSNSFKFSDVQLIAHHILSKWQNPIKPTILCFWDKATKQYDVDGITIIPIDNNLPGVWSRMILYAPQTEKFRPFLYLDLDTAVIQSVERIFDLITDESQFITLEDFYQAGELATGIVWFPEKNEKIFNVWKFWNQNKTFVKLNKRMDFFLRHAVKADTFWQKLTPTIKDFKPKRVLTIRPYLEELPDDTNLVCFHGNPRIPNADFIPWVKDYLNY